jgi:DNA primase
MRSDCPVCNKANTFSVTDKGLERLWYCFHADCHTKGRTGVTLTKESVQQAFAKKVVQKETTDSAFEIPDTFVSLSRNLDAESYVRRVGAYDAYLAGLADIRYDVKQHRVVFLIKDKSRIIDAAGRALRNIKPKWYRYNDGKFPFLCGSSSVALVVEDASSACAVSNLVTGVALLGTNLQQSYIDVLKKFDKVYVALDKDATKTGLEIVTRLSNHVATKLVILQRDLKDMRKDERDEFIRSKLN